MDNSQYENFLGKNINEITINGIKPSQSYIPHKYSIFFEHPIQYFNKKIYFIYFITNTDDNIVQINISLAETIDKSFFNTLEENYGQPNNILVVDEIIDVSESTISQGGFHQELKKRHLKMREGIFEENPLSIIWKKDKFQLDVLIKEKLNKTEILFKHN